MKDKTIKIPLSQGKFAIVDEQDEAKVWRYTWSLSRTCGLLYAVTFIRQSRLQQSLLLHRYLLDAPQGIEVDHIDNDGLNNRRCNLRLATRVQNTQNSRMQSNNKSGFKGVSWHKQDRKWIATIQINGRYMFLGHFDDKRMAANAYDKAAREFFGEFAKPNTI